MTELRQRAFPPEYTHVIYVGEVPPKRLWVRAPNPLTSTMYLIDYEARDAKGQSCSVVQVLYDSSKWTGRAAR